MVEDNIRLYLEDGRETFKGVKLKDLIDKLRKYTCPTQNMLTSFDCNQDGADRQCLAYHSMGGMVLELNCYKAETGDDDWIELTLDDVRELEEVARTYVK